MIPFCKGSKKKEEIDKGIKDKNRIPVCNVLG